MAKKVKSNESTCLKHSTQPDLSSAVAQQANFALTRGNQASLQGDWRSAPWLRTTRPPLRGQAGVDASYLTLRAPKEGKQASCVTCNAEGPRKGQPGMLSPQAEKSFMISVFRLRYGTTSLGLVTGSRLGVARRGVFCTQLEVSAGFEGVGSEALWVFGFGVEVLVSAERGGRRRMVGLLNLFPLKNEAKTGKKTSQIQRLTASKLPPPSSFWLWCDEEAFGFLCDEGERKRIEPAIDENSGISLGKKKTKTIFTWRALKEAGNLRQLSCGPPYWPFCYTGYGNLIFDGEITEWSVDPDLWCYFGILASIKVLGHVNIKELWYSLGGVSIVKDRLELLTDDTGVMHMLNIARLNDEVHLYVVHNRIEPDIIEMIDWVDGEVEAEVGTQMKEVEVEAVGDADIVGRGLDEAELGTEIKEVQGDGVAAEVGGEMEEAEGDVEAELGTEIEEVQGDGVVAEVRGEMEEVEEIEEVQGGLDGDSEEVQDEAKVYDFEVEDVHEDEDEGGDDGDDEGGEDVGVEYEDEDENVDDSISIETESLVDVRVEGDMGASKGQPCSPKVECSMTSDNDAVHDVCGLSDIEWVSDKLDSGPDSEDDDPSIPKTLFPTFTMPKSLGEYKWEVGTYFTNKKEFTDAIRTYALSNGKNLKLIKNDNKRVTVKCFGANGKCKWYAHCAYVCLDKSWQLRKVIDEHTCSRDFNVKLITTKWLSERMEKTMRESPNMKVMDIREKLSRKWNVAIS
ncbi:hypothetical protein V8G54_016972 [Vigna mungo]|uniref:Transposase MuDR plant domain-containing protein n=1 Tax=Vigna mungo TaxID=3915 RepID=A0AAQ3NPT2_VIGMU